jgi:polyisoprenoid-binding protein YceI
MSFASLRLAFAPFVAVLGFSAVGPRPFLLDPAQSQVTFLASSKLDDAHGSFASYVADVAFDPDTIANSSVRISIAAASIATGIDRRDHHLKSCDFFCVDSFPQIVFQSQKVLRVGPDRYRIDGSLTMRGITRPMSIPTRMLTNAGGAARFSGEFALDRRDFGLGYSSVLNPIKDTVQVAFTFALTDPAPGPRAP